MICSRTCTRKILPIPSQPHAPNDRPLTGRRRKFLDEDTAITGAETICSDQPGVTTFAMGCGRVLCRKCCCEDILQYVLLSTDIKCFMYPLLALRPLVSTAKDLQPDIVTTRVEKDLLSENA